jgi:hypothetical protein
MVPVRGAIRGGDSWGWDKERSQKFSGCLRLSISMTSKFVGDATEDRCKRLKVRVINEMPVHKFLACLR